MRWLLIALVVLLQVQMPAAPAQAAESSCHSAPADMTHDPAPSDHDAMGKAAHMCPGCSIPAIAPQARAAGDWRPVVPAPGNYPALVSHMDPPMVPPPRMA